MGYAKGQPLYRTLFHFRALLFFVPSNLVDIRSLLNPQLLTRPSLWCSLSLDSRDVKAPLSSRVNTL